MRRRTVSWLALLCLGWLLAACGQSSEQVGGVTVEPDLLDAAAAEATSLVQQARATAIVLEARAQATALIEGAGRATATLPPPTVALPVVASQSLPEPTPDPPVDRAPDEAAARSTPAEVLSTVEVLSVGFAGEGGMIIVRFRAPPDEAAKWWPGTVSVVDEGSGTVYGEIPVMPKVGPLIGRPKREGQLGYVMLVNQPPGLQPGALVTVVLGAYQFEHIPVQ